MTRNFWNNNTLDSFAKHIAPVLNALAEEDGEATYGNRVYDMSFTSEGKDALRSFYADTCRELTDEDISWLEDICKKASDSVAYWRGEEDEDRAMEVLFDVQQDIFEWVMGESSYIELDNESATDAGEYRRVCIYLSELLWKEEHGKDRLSKTVYDIIDEATANWKDAQDYCY